MLATNLFVLGVLLGVCSSINPDLTVVAHTAVMALAMFALPRRIKPFKVNSGAFAAATTKPRPYIFCGVFFALRHHVSLGKERECVQWMHEPKLEKLRLPHPGFATRLLP